MSLIAKNLVVFHLVSHEVYDDILDHTNLYATQQQALKGDNSYFDPIIKVELITFVGIKNGNKTTTVKQRTKEDNTTGVDANCPVMIED